MITSAQRMEYLSPHFFASLGAKIAAMQADHRDVIRLDEGSPDMPPAPAIIKALARSAAAQDHHSYQPHRGPQALRKAWAEMYSRVFRVDLDPESEIFPLMGSKEGIFHLTMAFVNPGDVVLVPDPGYVTYPRAALFCGGEPYTMPLLPERSYLPDFHAVPPDVARRAKLLWLNYPNNPTATVATPDFFAEAVNFARECDILLCHDAAYAQVTFDGYRAPSLLEIPGAMDVAVEFNTLSKSHNMAGWRVGAVLGNPQAVRTLYTLKTNVDSGHFLPIMEAAAEAMTGDQSWLKERNDVYRQRRDLVIQALRNLGFKVASPRASLYVWCPVPDGWTSAEFTTAALEQAGVSLTPGTFFGKNGEGYVRISLTAPAERISEAMHRLTVLQQMEVG